MSRKADIAAAIEAAGGWHINAEKVKEAVNLAYDLGVQEVLRIAERRIKSMPCPAGWWDRHWHSWGDAAEYMILQLREARKGKK